MPKVERQMDAIAEKDLTALGQSALADRLPNGWEVRPTSAPRELDWAFEVVAPDGTRGTVIVEAKTITNARDVPLLLDRFTRADPGAAARLVVSRYLSPRAREALTERDLSYVDATGNIRVDLRRPAVFVQEKGADSDPWRTPDRPTNTLKGRPASRIVRALVDIPRTWKMRDLAQVASTSLGSTARTVEFLDREALIERDGAGSIVGVSWEDLLVRWAADYDLLRSGEVVRAIEPRRLDGVERALLETGSRYVISGSLAARWWAPAAEPTTAIVFTDEPGALASELGLRTIDRGANVLFIRPFDEVVFQRPVEREGNLFAALAQVVVDLLSGPGRNPSEAEVLLGWMRRNEPQWRPAD